MSFLKPYFMLYCAVPSAIPVLFNKVQYYFTVIVKVWELTVPDETKQKIFNSGYERVTELQVQIYPHNKLI